MNPNVFEQAKFKRKTKPLLFYLRALKRFHLPFFPLVLQYPLEIRWERNFSISWSRGFGLVGPYENLFVGPFPFCCTLFSSFSSGHHQLIFLGLGKLFPSLCAFCLFLKLFSQIFNVFHEVWKLCFVFHLACLPPTSPRFEKSCVLCKNP